MSLRNFYNRMIAAREKQAKAYVNNALFSLDNETLKNAGIKRENLKPSGSNYPF
jgi:hypothetical protein